ncbi:MAG: UDP-3-O-(3-hydroxymyristoyl)glucosamine N-acyltransferase [Saprospiraceae bacterium]|nr:UDP-3-O-(3-hydroxymyristoyl)glucosamine N-acyltransferase [Saprospiraceae bacterium]
MFDFKDLEKCLPIECEIVGNPNNIRFDNFGTLEDYSKNSIIWVAKRNAKLQLSISPNVIITEFNEFRPFPELDCTVIMVSNPKITYSKILEELFTSKVNYIVSELAEISNLALIGKNVNIGPFTRIGKVTIGNNVHIGSGVSIYDNTHIGDNVIIKDNSVIGGDGFGYIKNEEGVYEKFIHVGGVMIESNVEIGSNTCIDRGSIGQTIIKKGVKIDNLVHIAHNVVIGENSIIVANSIIGGSTILGKGSWVAPSVTIRDGLKICDNVTLGMASVVTKDINVPGIYLGVPAKIKIS